MDGFLRRLAALGVLTTLCELLLPEGGTRRVARLTVGLLTTAMLLGAFLSVRSAVLGGGAASPEAAVVASAEAFVRADGERYRDAALQARANQASDACGRLLAAAGYRGDAVVTVDADGAIVSVELRAEAEAPLLSPDELSQRVAEAFALERAQVKP